MPRLLTLFSIALCLCFAACKKSSKDPDWTKTYTYQDGMRIDSFTTGGVTAYVVGPGDKRVFRFKQERGANDPNSNYFAYLSFQTDSGATSVSASMDELQDLSTNYYSGGATGGYAAVALNKGSINGSRTDATHWQIHIDVTLPVKDGTTGRLEIVEDAAFVLQP